VLEGADGHALPPLPPSAQLIAWLGMVAGMGWLGLEGHRMASLESPFDILTFDGMFHAAMTAYAALGAVSGLGILQRREWARRTACMAAAAVAVTFAIFGALEVVGAQGDPAALARVRRDAVGNSLIAFGLAALVVWCLRSPRTCAAMVRKT
jgi:hypothetical protein